MRPRRDGERINLNLDRAFVEGLKREKGICTAGPAILLVSRIGWLKSRGRATLRWADVVVVDVDRWLLFLCTRAARGLARSQQLQFSLGDGGAGVGVPAGGHLIKEPAGVPHIEAVQQGLCWHR